MRVMLSCPYSLSLFGGVQAQVLGLARALRSQGVDARIIAPCDGPPPEPGITTVGPSTRVPSNGSVAPVAAGRAVARRTMEALRTFEPDVVHLHEPFSPGANHAALVGTEIPAVGTFHSRAPGGTRGTRRCGHRSGRCSAGSRRRPRCPTKRRARLRSHSVPSARSSRTAWTSIGSRRVTRAFRRDRRSSSWAGSSRARVCRCCSMRSRVSTVTRTSGSRATARSATSWARVTRSSVQWLGRISDDEKATRFRSASVACFPADRR